MINNTEKKKFAYTCCEDESNWYDIDMMIMTGNWQDEASGKFIIDELFVSFIDLDKELVASRKVRYLTFTDEMPKPIMTIKTKDSIEKSRQRITYRRAPKNTDNLLSPQMAY